MKVFCLSLTVLLCAIGGVCMSQNQNPNHPTINKVSVAYVSLPKANQNSQTPDIQCVPQATISLKTNAVQSIHFKMLNQTTKAVIYQVDYNLNAGTIKNSAGKKLFEVNNANVFISSGQTMTLQPVLYEIQTGDNSNNLSTVFSTIK